MPSRATSASEQLAALWEELFGIAPIGIDDSFLELGGHSLLAIQMVTQIRALFEADLPVTALFEAPTIVELASWSRRAQGEESAEDIEALLALIEGLSPEEAAAKLAEMGAGAVSLAERLSALTPEQRALFEALRRKQQGARPRSRLLPPPVRRVTGPDRGRRLAAVDRPGAALAHAPGEPRPGLLERRRRQPHARRDRVPALAARPARADPPPRRLARHLSRWSAAGRCSGSWSRPSWTSR